MFEGAPFRLNQYMSGSRFGEITGALMYTDKATPDPTNFIDRFHGVRQMLNAWNDHYAEGFMPAWINVLDETMNPFFDPNCPGFMCVPRKPHPFGNEYHTIAHGVFPSGGCPIIWRHKIQEGKDRPKNGNRWAFPSEFETGTTGKSKSAVLMLEMTKPIHATGRVVTMDSGFCVTAGILAMHDHGVFGQALIKKRGRYWPKGFRATPLMSTLRTRSLARRPRSRRRLMVTTF